MHSYLHASLDHTKLALQYYTKLQSCPSNPAFECTIDPKYKELFARKESAIPSFGIRIQSVLYISNILNDNVDAIVISHVPPWTMHHPKVCLDLSVLAKKDTPSHIYIQKFYESKGRHKRESKNKKQNSLAHLQFHVCVTQKQKKNIA